MRLLTTIGLIVLANCSVKQSFAQTQSDSILKRSSDALKSHFTNTLTGVSDKLSGEIPKLSIPADSIVAKKIAAFGSAQVKPVSDAVKGAISQASSLVKLFDKGKFIEFNKLELAVDYTYIDDTSSMNIGGYTGPLQNNVAYNFSFSTSVGHLPFTAGFAGNNTSYTISHAEPNTLSRFNFDHEKYIETIKSKVLEKIKPEEIAAATVNRLNSIKATYQKMLMAELSQLQSGLMENYKQELHLPADITDLDVSDISSLKSKIISTEAVSKYKSSVDKMQEMLKTSDIRNLQSDSVYQQLAGDVKQFEALEKSYSKVLYWKECFNNNKVVKTLRSQLPFEPGNFKSFLNNPKNLNAVLKQHANLSSLQSMFTKITKLDIGQNAVSGGQFDVNNVINAGINSDFKSDKISLGVIAGKNNMVNNWLQSGLISTATTEYSKLTGVSVGTGNNAAVSNALSLNLFEFSNTPGFNDVTNMMQPGFLPVAPHKDAVIALQTTYPIASKHSVTVDVSKSFGLFKNSSSADSTFSKSNPLSSLLSNDGKASYAAMIDYSGKIAATEVNVSVKKVGLGYSNPGNSFLRKGESQFSLSAARKFMKNKLSVKYSTDYRTQYFDPEKNYTYTSFSNKAQLSYRLNRDTRFKISYQQSSSKMDLFDAAATDGKNSRLQLDGAYRFRINGRKVTSNAGIGMSRMILPLLTGGTYRNISYNILHTSSIVLGKNIVSVSMFASRSDNREYYFNTSMLNAEANYSYMLWNAMRFGSGIGYYENAGWNKQVGVKQQLSITLMKKLSADAEVGYKKAIKTYRAELANQLYLSAGMRYHF